MKPLPVLLLFLALVSFAIAGCGSGTKANSGPITVTGTTTVSNLETGALVTCKSGLAGAKVPPPGEGVTANVDGTTPSTTGTLQVTHRQDGSVVATCRKG
jgi:hypothetical protein